MSKKYYSEEKYKELLKFLHAYKQHTTHEFYEDKHLGGPDLVIPSTEVSALDILVRITNEESIDIDFDGEQEEIIEKAMHTYGTQLLAQCVAKEGEQVFRLYEVKNHGLPKEHGWYYTDKGFNLFIPSDEMFYKNGMVAFDNTVEVEWYLELTKPISLPAHKWPSEGSESLPNEIDLVKLAGLLRYSNKYEISVQFWPKQTAVYIEKDGVSLADFGGGFDFAIEKSIEYLSRINPSHIKNQQTDKT